MPDRTSLTSTYRLQLHADFGFAAAVEVVDYLQQLGVSHLYLSPVLQAAPGSMHGYDVVDHTRVSEALGGRDGLVALAEAAHRRGLGIVVDVVPNHMAVPQPLYLNQPLWDTLRLGRDAEFAHWFDIDWDLCGGKIGLPVLGSSLDEALADGQLELSEHEGSPVIRYYDNVFPVAPGTADGPVEKILDRQHYLLAFWRDKAEVLGYRRFFDVDTLAAVRVELPDVFRATHQVLLELCSEGMIDGFRIDHPDGLADPEGYLEQLAAATGDAWVVVEKILEGDEQLPASWQTAGSTGYDAIKAIDGALVPQVGPQLDALWRDTSGEPSLERAERAAKGVAIDLLKPELARLVRRAVGAASALGKPLTGETASEAFTELLTHVEVYRAYLRLDTEPNADALGRLDALFSSASDARPDLSEPLDVLRGLLTDTHSTNPDVRDLVVRFQQVCGPVMAKGIEDTTFYRWHRLIALNEVGGDPRSLDQPSADRVHNWATYQSERHPLGMTTLSTHDTKRGEDVRARLLAAAEDIDGWTRVWSLLREQADALEVDQPTAYLLMQTLVGAWPISEERLSAYLEKAMREAKQHTTWVDPNADYEAKVLKLARLSLTSGPVRDAIGAWVDSLAGATRAVTLAAKLLQLTLPGVPDTYQGCETVERSLVDPDNRRPVDFEARQRRLARLDAGEPRQDLDDDKLWVTSRVLRLRRDRPELFGATSTYRPLITETPYALGFLHSEQVATLVTRWPGQLAASGDAVAGTVALPDGDWADVLTGHHLSGGGDIAVAELLGDFPVALLVREGE